MDKQLYGSSFSSKKSLLKWLEEHEDEIDWDYDVELSWYYKDDNNQKLMKISEKLLKIGKNNQLEYNWKNIWKIPEFSVLSECKSPLL